MTSEVSSKPSLKSLPSKTDQQTANTRLGASGLTKNSSQDTGNQGQFAEQLQKEPTPPAALNSRTNFAANSGANSSANLAPASGVNSSKSSATMPSTNPSIRPPINQIINPSSQSAGPGKSPAMPSPQRERPTKSSINPPATKASAQAPDLNDNDRDPGQKVTKRPGNANGKVHQADRSQDEGDSSIESGPEALSTGENPGDKNVADKLLRQLGANYKQAVAAVPVVALLTGHLEQLSPQEIPSLVSDNAFLQEALGQNDVDGFMHTPQKLDKIVKDLGLPQSLLQSGNQMGISPSTFVSPQQLLKALGIDAQQVFAELTLMQENLGSNGLTDYMLRAQILGVAAPMPSPLNNSQNIAQDPSKGPPKVSNDNKQLGVQSPLNPSAGQQLFGGAKSSASNMGVSKVTPTAGSVAGPAAMNPVAMNPVAMSSEAVNLPSQNAGTQGSLKNPLNGLVKNDRDGDLKDDLQNSDVNLAGMLAAYAMIQGGASGFGKGLIESSALDPEGTQTVSELGDQSRLAMQAKIAAQMENAANSIATKLGEHNQQLIRAGENVGKGVGVDVSEVHQKPNDDFTQLPSSEDLNGKVGDAGKFLHPQTGEFVNSKIDDKKGVTGRSATLDSWFLMGQKLKGLDSLDLAKNAKEPPMADSLDLSLSDQVSKSDIRDKNGIDFSRLAQDLGSDSNLKQNKFGENNNLNIKDFAKITSLGDQRNSLSDNQKSTDFLQQYTKGQEAMAVMTSGQTSGLSAKSQQIERPVNSLKIDASQLDPRNLTFTGGGVATAVDQLSRDRGDSFSRDQKGDDQRSGGDRQGVSELSGDFSVHTTVSHPKIESQFGEVYNNPLAGPNTNSPIMNPAERAMLVQQIFDRATALSRAGGGSMHLDLGSPEIGKLEMAVHLVEDRLDVRIITGSDHVRSALASDLSRLKDTLASQNISLGKIDVGVEQNQGRPFSQSNGQSFANDRSNRNNGQESSRDHLAAIQSMANFVARSQLKGTQIDDKRALNTITPHNGVISLRV